MNALLQQIMGSVDQSAIQQISTRLGIPPDQAQNAVGSALPLILGAMGRQASSPDGADAIHAAAQGNPGNAQDMLGQIFGGQQDRAAQGVGAVTGLPQEHAAQVLSILTPMVLTAIRNHAAQTGIGAQGLGQVLGDAAQQAQGQGGGIAQRLLGAVLDKNADGHIDFTDLTMAGEQQIQQHGGISGMLGSLFGKR